jgi:DNA invertase Pin-like site-specific DNA recombinase
MEFPLNETPPSLFLRFVQASSAAIAADPRVPVEVREPLARAAEQAMCAQWRDLIGEERVRFRAPQRGPRAREWTHEQVQAMAQAGETYTAIAKRLQIDRTTVGRIAKRRRREGAPP